jgi:hypothetical protein
MGRLGRALVWVLEQAGFEGVYLMYQRRGRPTQFWMFGRVMKPYASNQQSEVLR